MRVILGKEVEGDEHGVNYLDSIDDKASELFEEAKYKHRAKFHDEEGRYYVLTRESPGHYLIAHVDSSTGWL